MRLLESASFAKGPFFVDKYNAADLRALACVCCLHQELDAWQVGAPL